MSTLNLNTWNQYIKGVVEHSAVRTETGYTVSYEVKFRRTNGWTGEHTHGTVKYDITLNGQSIDSGSKYIDIWNGGNYYTLVSGSYDVEDLDVFNSPQYTIGYKSTTGGNYPSGLMCDLHTSEQIIVGSYASHPTHYPTITISDLGDNSFNIHCTTSTDGENNMYRYTNYFYQIDGGEVTTNKFVIENGGTNVPVDLWCPGEDDGIPVSKTSIVHTWAVNVHTQKSYSVEDIKTINYYSTPEWISTPIIEYDTEGITDKSTLTISWSGCVQFDEHNTQRGYQMLIYKNGILVAEGVDTVATITTVSLADLGCVVGDRVAIQIIAFSYNGAGDRMTSDIETVSIDVQSSSTVEVFINDSPVLCQVYAKDKGFWVESTGIYSHNGTQWKSSI